MIGLIQKFIQGLIFGLGFAIAFIVVLVLFITFYFSGTSGDYSFMRHTAVDEVSQPPVIEERYLGSTRLTSGYISIARETVLSAGPGEIRGFVVGDDEQVEGLQLRLVLNGSVMSQWATTNAVGEYSIAVPYGEYEVNGFELDSRSANSALPGLIIRPNNIHNTGRFFVEEDQHGTGPHLRFVTPVAKRVQKPVFSVDEPVRISWEPYPGAVRYRVQVYQKPNAESYLGNDTLFDWSSIPEVTDTHLDLNDYSAELKPGYFYTYQVTAIGENGDRISETNRIYLGYDFTIKR